MAESSRVSAAARQPQGDGTRRRRRARAGSPPSAAEDVRADDARTAPLDVAGAGPAARGACRVMPAAGIDGGARVAVVVDASVLLHAGGVELDDPRRSPPRRRRGLCPRWSPGARGRKWAMGLSGAISGCGGSALGRARVVAHAPVGHAGEREEPTSRARWRARRGAGTRRGDEVVDAVLLREERGEGLRGVDVANVDGERLVERRSASAVELAQAASVELRAAPGELTPDVGGAVTASALRSGERRGRPAVAALAGTHARESWTARTLPGRRRAPTRKTGRPRGRVTPCPCTGRRCRRAHEVRRDQGRVGGVVLRVALVGREDLLPARLLRRRGRSFISSASGLLPSESSASTEASAVRSSVALLLRDARPLTQGAAPSPRARA